MNNTQQQSRANALIEKIQKDASKEVDNILTAAKEQAEAVTQKARLKARLKVHDVVESLRTREQREVSRELARFETERRQWRQSDEMHALAEGLKHLNAALNGLWSEKDSREQWCHNVLSVAMEHLPAENWRLKHPADYPQDELANLARKIASHTGVSPECEADDGLCGGLHIYAGTACVDGSIGAMIADRNSTSAKFLSVLLTMREEGMS